MALRQKDKFYAPTGMERKHAIKGLRARKDPTALPFTAFIPRRSLSSWTRPLPLSRPARLWPRPDFASITPTPTWSTTIRNSTDDN